MEIKIKNPLFLLKLAVVIMSLVGVTKLIGLLLPIIIMPYDFILWGEFFVSLIKDIGEVFNITNTGLVIYLLLQSFVISFIYITSGIFILFRKPWARRLIVYSLVIVIPLSFINSILVYLDRGFYSPNYDGVLNLIFHIYLLYFFTRPEIKQLFPERPTG